MDLDVEQLAAAVLHLPAADRASFAARLLASLDEDAAERAAYDAACEAELDRREAAAVADPDGDVPADVILAEARAELRAAARRDDRVSPRLGGEFLGEVERAFGSVVARPAAGSPRP